MTYCETVQIQSAAEVSGVRHMDAGNDAGGVTENQKTSPGPDRSCRTDCNIGSTDSGSGSTAATAEHTGVQKKKRSFELSHMQQLTDISTNKG